MKIIEKRLADIIPYENNPRRNEQAVLNSLVQAVSEKVIFLDK